MLSTKLPDGSDGWSLFLSLTATFPSLQLGFGFTLNGVGGLVGIHRGLDDVALGDGIRAGSLDSILFPEDPIADAATIISDIEAIFPTQQGQFVFGPVGVIGWGTPTVVELELGVIVELPDPLAIALLGSLSAVLPDDEAAILVLHVDVAGVLDLTAGTIAVDASLHDSQVAGIALSGDMAVRADFLSQPGFLLSFGGFNPHYPVPDTFPDLDRLSVSLDAGANLRLGLWGYFAVTANTVQFGAGADLWAKADGLTVEGHLSFDALIQFNPFLFTVGTSIQVDVRAGTVELFGVHLDITLAGPNPFHVSGTATMKILGLQTSFAVDETIGRRELSEPPQPVYALPLLLAALRDPGAWREVLPDGGVPAVTLTDAATDAGVLLHPAGALEVVQRVLPLGRTLDHFGEGELGDLDSFELGQPTVGDQPASAVTDVVDWFAPAQFFDLTEAEKLSAPSFEELPAGLRFEAPEVAGGVAAAFVLDYEQVIRDPDLAEVDVRPEAIYTPTAAALSLAVRYSTAGRPRLPAAVSRSRAAASPYQLHPASWLVTDAATGHVIAPPAGAGERQSWSQARTALRDPNGTGQVLVPAHEAEVAA